MAAHSRVPAWENPMDRGAWWATWSHMESQRAGYNLATKQPRAFLEVAGSRYSDLQKCSRIIRALGM